MIVVWSGGCDSTLALYDALKKAESMGDVSTVRAISVNHFAVCANVEQRNARARIHAKLTKMGLGFAHQELKVDLSGKQEVSFGPNADFHGLNQPQIWIPTVASFLGHDEDLTCGYIAGDCVWHYIGHLHYMFDGLQGIAGRTGKLLFPLEWTEKHQVISRLKSIGLYDLCWWCETSGPLKASALSKPCGKCPPCVTHEMALLRLQRRPVELTDDDEGEMRKK